MIKNKFIVIISSPISYIRILKMRFWIYFFISFPFYPLVGTWVSFFWSLKYLEWLAWAIVSAYYSWPQRLLSYGWYQEQSITSHMMRKEKFQQLLVHSYPMLHKRIYYSFRFFGRTRTYIKFIYKTVTKSNPDNFTPPFRSQTRSIINSVRLECWYVDRSVDPQSTPMPLASRTRY